MATPAPLSLFAGVRRFPPVRRRGGQPGNRNRLTHGGFSNAAHKRREAVRRVVRHLNFKMAQAEAWHECELIGAVAEFSPAKRPLYRLRRSPSPASGGGALRHLALPLQSGGSAGEAG